MSFEADVVRLPPVALDALLDTSPRAAASVAELLWHGNFSVSGSLSRLGSDSDVLTVIQLAAACEIEDPDLLAELLDSATPLSNDTTDAAHAIAVQALGRPTTMRWITANADRVARSANWATILPGLGGVTKSVPLAEEALIALMREKAKLPRELTAYVQLNPWFSRRFALRYRRKMRGKRIRLAERGATTRGWSHARTLLLPRLPAPWQALLKRGVGRPLDKWSTRLLARYVETFHAIYKEEGIPPVLANLYVIAAASIDTAAPSEHLAARWSALPSSIEQRARSLVGLTPPPSCFGAGNADIVGLRSAIDWLGEEAAGWQKFAEAAATAGIARAADDVVQPSKGH